MKMLPPLSRRWSYAALAGAALVLVAITAARMRQSRAFTESNAAVLRTTEVLSELANLASHRRAREIATMLWITRDDQEALAAGRAQRETIDSAVARLRQMTVESPVQQQRLREFAAMMASRADLLARGNGGGAREAMLDSAITFGLRAEGLIAALQAQERGALAAQRAAAAQAEANWRRWAALAALTSFSFAIIALLSLRIQRRADLVIARQVRESEARFRAAAESGMDLFLLLEPESSPTHGGLRVADANARAAAAVGLERETLLGKDWTELHPDGCALPADLARQAHAVLRTGTSTEGVQDVPGEGDSRTFRYQLVPAGSAVAFTCREITHEVRLTEQLQQSQKLDALGRMASGVAHDFNNLLTVLRAEADMVLADPRLDPALRPEILDMARAVDRGAGLTQRLLAFSRKQVTAPRPMALDRAIEELRTFLVRMLPRTVAVETEHAADLPPVVLDPVQLDQLILNLAANARDAMPGGGTLHLRTDVVRLSHAEVTGPSRVPEGRWVRLRVRDTGTGMSRSVMDRVFEPFFTTKAPGRGTGLGLASVHGIVSQAGGHITVDSTLDRGTEFTIYLPPQSEEEQGPELVPAGAWEAGSTDRMILVAEDDPAVRAVTERVLARAGYRVLAAASGEEALDLFRRHLAEIDVLLTDMVMPGMNGQELAVRATREKPDLRVLFVSGYVGDAVQIPADVVTAGRFLQKPFTTDELLERVARLGAA